MAIHDLRDLPDGSQLNADVCIVGTGPAGLTIALQFIGTSTQVCVLESGGFSAEAETESLGGFENVGLRRAPNEIVRCRGFGGTSALWTGRCGVFDEIDYQERSWVPNSGWPIRAADLEPYLDQAGAILGLGPAVYSDRIWELLGYGSDSPPRWDPGQLLPVVWQYSKRSGASAEAPAAAAAGTNVGVHRPMGTVNGAHVGQEHGSAFAAADNVRVLLHANATSVGTDDAGARVRSVEVRSLEGKRARVHAGTVVLCCGGIDNARLLLASNSADPRGVGNAHDVVGRFLMDHPYVPLATYHGAGSKRLRRRLGHRWLDWRGKRHVYQLGLRMSPLEQRRRGLLNAAVHALEFGSGLPAISAAGRVARALKSGRLSDVNPAHVWQAVGHPGALIMGMRDRYLLHRPMLSPVDRVELGCIVEQVPDPESRVTLSASRDALGMNRARINWRASDLEFGTVREMASILMGEIGRLGYEAPELTGWLKKDDAASYRSTIRDYSHPMGTTRMSADPKKGVVDADCRVHGVEGLYVAGSSVFSTSGYMNPTLMIVTLSLRLAAHLKDRCAPARVAPTLVAPAVHVQGGSAAGLRRLRVGIVGAGDRIRTLHHPVLAALRDKFEPVGFTTRSRQTSDAFSSETGIPAFPDAASMVASGKPDLLIMAVSKSSIPRVVNQLIELGVPLLLETPLAQSVRTGRQILGRINRSRLIVGIAEQTPFLPVEQMKRRLIDLGVIGPVVAAHNDFLSYDYHGIARLRSHIGNARSPLSISAVETRTCNAKAVAGPNASRPETWTLASVLFDDGAALVHHYSAAYFDAPFRGPRTFRVHGTAGSLVDDEIVVADANGQTQRSVITRVMEAGRLLELSARTPLGEVRWVNPYSSHSLSDEQIAVATLLDRMRNAILFGGLPAYTASEALADIEFLAAMRYSARLGGAAVRMPLNPVFERARVAALARGPRASE